MSSDEDVRSDAESERGNIEVIEDEDDEEEPTEEEIRDYAEYLGIDPDKEPHLMWIARKGVGAPVPKPWRACKEGDEVFYYNFDTNESMWDHPLDAKFRNAVEKHRKAGPGGLPERISDDEADQKSEVSEDIPSANSTPASTPAGASAGQRKCLESGGEAAGGPISASSMGTSPTGAAADLDVANESHSFVSEAVESEDMEEQQEDSRTRSSPQGVPRTPSNANDDTKSSFVSDLVDESDLTDAHVANEMAQTQPDQVTKEAMDEAASAASKPSSPTVAKLSMKDAAALWSAGAGGTAFSTPRSPASSSSRSRSSSPRGGGPVSASSSASAAEMREHDAKPPDVTIVTPSEAKEFVSDSDSVAVGHGGGKLLLTFKESADMTKILGTVKTLAMVTSTELLDGAEIGLVSVSDVSAAEAAIKNIEGVASVEVDQEVSIAASGKPVVDRMSSQPTVRDGGGKLLLTFKESADMTKILSKVKTLATVTSTELLDGAEIGLVGVSDVSAAEAAIKNIEGVASVEVDQEVSIAISGKPVVDRISSQPLDAHGVLRKSPAGSPSSGDRPRPVLDNVACGHSARSSNPSEVSEDFRSDFLSPPMTARSGSGNAVLGAEGQSLEVSMSMDGRSVDTEGAAKTSLSRSPTTVCSPSLASVQVPRPSSKRTWVQLQQELQVLSKALASCERIRSQQREYLELLKIDSLKVS